MKRKKEVGKGNKLQGKKKFDKIRMSLRAQKKYSKNKVSRCSIEITTL